MAIEANDEPDRGPAIDVHHHLWDLSMGRHPWLAPTGGLTAIGDLSYLRHDYGLDELARDIAGTNVVATVHVEALWDLTRDPTEETAWLDSLPLRDGVAVRCVAAASFTSPDVDEVLAAQARHARVAGIRQTIRWHPDPALRWTEDKVVENPAWRRSVALLERHGFLLELLMNPWQANAVADLAVDFPSLPIVVNHCATPVDRDEAGIRRWRDGLVAMGRTGNVHLKLSNFVRYAAGHDVKAARDVLSPCIDAFGAERCLWGSDYPVARREMTYAGTLNLFRQSIATLPRAAQRAILHDNAARLYRIPDGGKPEGDAP